MVRLGAMIGCGAVLWWAQTTAASTYVPGEVRDGVYVRPHYVAVSEQVGEDPFVAMDKGGAIGAEPHADPAVLQETTLPPPAEDASS